MNSKNNKKKILVLALLIFAAIGFAGYGVYSYFYSQASISGSDTISIVAFDPEVEIDSSEAFLGNGGTVELSCPTTSTGNGTVTCTQSLEVTNRGGTDVTITVTPGESSEYGESHYFEGDASSPSFNWTSATLEPNESRTLNVSVDVSLSGEYGSSTAVETSYAFDGDSFRVYTNFSMTATQAH